VRLEVGLQPIPGHRLTRPLGVGAFGKVWEAVRDDKSRVALKFLDCRQLSAGLIASEVRILRALADVQHPHIIPLLGVHASGKYMILSMERADGNLADLQQAYRETTGSNIPPDHALELLEQAADALDFLAAARLPGVTTSRGLQHCDIKPSNLLLVGETLKVADFGLCAGSGAVTHRKGWKGTLPYAAPELYGGAATAGTDQYALAVTFCELVMGPRPFWPGALSGNAPAGLPIDMTKLRDKEFPVIARALHPYPSSRFPTCKDFVEALRKAVGLPRSTAETRVYPPEVRAAAIKRSSGRHRVVKAPSASTGMANPTGSSRPNSTQLLHPSK
jgi:serine/threonine protein kinase, bacterial